LGLAAWWLVMRIIASPVPPMRQPVRITAVIFAAAVLASYVAASTRVIAPAEQRAADMGLLSILAWMGILFVTTDGPVNRKELDILLRRLCIGGAALATFGLIQFVTKQSFTNYLHVPGLTVSADISDINSRGGLARPAGTALHPIEFGAVLTTILPIALHYALTDKHRGLIARWYPVAAIAVAVPISISRSAIVSAIVVLCFLLPTWSPALRRRSIVALATLSIFLYAASPGLVRTLTSLFSGISNDPSTQLPFSTPELAIKQATVNLFADMCDTVGQRCVQPRTIQPGLFAETASSGNANVVTPGLNGAGQLQQGYVEASNVNVVQELVNMIQTQRAYEINSKAVTTSDQMLQTLSQMQV